MAKSLELNLAALRAFATVAQELNMRRSAEILHISQPPLSRKIRQLEKELDLFLFERHASGLSLTLAGKQALAIIEPLLALEVETGRKLLALSANNAKPAVIGLTTAFEQGIFQNVIIKLQERYGGSLAVIRASSPDLVKAVARGNIDAALVAMPVDLHGLVAKNIGYEEELMAALPEKWPEASQEALALASLGVRPFFWFAKSRNPAWHGHMAAAFRQEKFRPMEIEEPLEHDVLLSRIAAGEGFAIMPASFAAISRPGVVFRKVLGLPPLYLAIIYEEENEIASKVIEMALAAFSAGHQLKRL